MCIDVYSSANALHLVAYHICICFPGLFHLALDFLDRDMKIGQNYISSKKMHGVLAMTVGNKHVVLWVLL